jgi:hypothetical protein
MPRRASPEFLAAAKRTFWKPGQTGNPKGRPKDAALRHGLSRELVRAKRHLVEKIVDDLLRGDSSAYQEMAKQNLFLHLLPVAQSRAASKRDRAKLKELEARVAALEKIVMGHGH